MGSRGCPADGRELVAASLAALGEDDHRIAPVLLTGDEP
jgi:hypothetical protein